MVRLIFLLLITVGAQAGTNFASSKTVFWRDLYPTGGRTLYCNQPFAGHSGLDIEHVYAANWMAKYLQCGTRVNCRKTSPMFNTMEAELHNLFPAMAGLNRTRSNHVFGIIPGEKRFLLACDFESEGKVTEPRPGARGDIARAIFYMHREYGLPIDAAMLPVLKQWNNDDPPDTQEIWRNDTIQRLQGNRNPFIDDPALGDGL